MSLIIQFPYIAEIIFYAKDTTSKVDLMQLKSIANLTLVIWSERPITDTNVYADEFTLSKWNCIPNLLSYKFRVR